MYRRPREEDRTPGQMMLRKLWLKDPGRFVDRLEKAERDYLAGRSKVVGESGSAAPVVDVGADAIDALLLKLLRGE